MADITGKILIEPNYENELAFENGVSPIKVKDFSYTHKINFAGNVLISDKGNSGARESRTIPCFFVRCLLVLGFVPTLSHG